MPNASQVRTKRAAFSLASMSSVPATCSGLLATTPTLRPSMRPKPTTMFCAHSSCTSTKSPSSSTASMTVCMSYGALLLSGMNVSSSVSSSSSSASPASNTGGSDRLLLGRNDSSVLVELERLVLVGAHEVRDAARAVVRPGAAEVLERDVLAGDGLDDVRAGDEHVRGLVDHQREVGERRRVDVAAGAEPRTRLSCGTTPEASVLR